MMEALEYALGFVLTMIAGGIIGIAIGYIIILIIRRSINHDR